MKFSLVLPVLTLTTTSLAQKRYSCDKCKPSATVDQCLEQYTTIHKGRTSWRFKCSSIHEDSAPCVSGKVIVANSTREVETKYTETCSLKSTTTSTTKKDTTKKDTTTSTTFSAKRPADLTCAAKCPPMKDYCFEIKTEQTESGRTKWTWACAPVEDCKEGVTVSDGERVEIAMCTQSHDSQDSESEDDDSGDDPDAKVESSASSSSEEEMIKTTDVSAMKSDSSGAPKDASSVSYSVASLLILVAGQYLL